MKSTSRLLLAPLLLATAGVSPAASILIDFGNTTYLSPDGSDPEYTGPVWNNFAREGRIDPNTDAGILNSFLMLENMKNSENVTTTVDLRYMNSSRDGVSGRDMAWGVGGQDLTDTTQPDYPLSATRDGFYLNDGTSTVNVSITLTFQLEGLTAGNVYDLRFYTGYDSSSTARGISQWGSGSSSVSQNPKVFGEPVTLTGLQADSEGNLQFTWTSIPGPGGASTLWATMEIIPEPSSALLAGSALLGGCFLRRRRA